MRLLLALTLLCLPWHAQAQTPAKVVLGWAYAPDVPQVSEAFDKDLWAG